jgi:CBS-domain-containing membrane protein
MSTDRDLTAFVSRSRVLLTFTPHARRVVVAALGGAIAVAGMATLGEIFGIALNSLPFVTSIVMVISAPESPHAQPRNILFGHILSATAGVAVAATLGAAPVAAAIAVGLAITLMLSVRALHPPAGINAFMAVTQQQSWSFIVAPVALGALLLIIFAYCYHRLAGGLKWPTGR